MVSLLVLVNGEEVGSDEPKMRSVGLLELLIGCLTLVELPGQLDGTVGQCLLGDLVPFLSGFDPRLFHGVNLKEAIELGLVSPRSIVVIEVDLTGRRVNDDGIRPVGQPDYQPADLAAEELGCAGDRWRQLEAATGGTDSCMVAQFGLDRDNVGQGWVSRIEVPKAISHST